MYKLFSFFGPYFA
jgi:hypothetical protein